MQSRLLCNPRMILWGTHRLVITVGDFSQGIGLCLRLRLPKNITELRIRGGVKFPDQILFTGAKNVE